MSNFLGEKYSVHVKHIKHPHWKRSTPLQAFQYLDPLSGQYPTRQKHIQLDGKAEKSDDKKSLS